MKSRLIQRLSILGLLLAGASSVVSIFLPKSGFAAKRDEQNGLLFYSANNGLTCVTSTAFQNCHDTKTGAGSDTTGIIGSTSGDNENWEDANTTGHDAF